METGLSLPTLDSDTKSLYCQPISAIHPHWPGIGFGQSDYFCTSFYYRIDIGILYSLLGYYEIYLETQLVILILHSSIPRETPLKLFQVKPVQQNNVAYHMRKTFCENKQKFKYFQLKLHSSWVQRDIIMWQVL